MNKPITDYDYSWRPHVNKKHPCCDCKEKRQALRKQFKGCHDHCEDYKEWKEKHEEDLNKKYQNNKLKADLRVCNERAIRSVIGG